MPMLAEILPLQRTELEALPSLSRGGHDGRNGVAGGCCFVEAVNHLAGRPWGDEPYGLGGVRATFFRVWNDDLHDGDRNALLHPLLRSAAAAEYTDGVDAAAAALLMDWLVRSYTRSWLRVAGADDAADLLERLPPITSADKAICRDAIWHNVLTSVAYNAGCMEHATRRGLEASRAARRKWDVSRTAWETGRREIGASGGYAALCAINVHIGITHGSSAVTMAWDAARSAIKTLVLSGPHWPSIGAVRELCQTSASRVAEQLLNLGDKP